MRSQFHIDYYQSILQLRPETIELMNFVENQFKNNEKVWISKKLKVKSGVDYYLSSNKFARILGKQLKKKFKGKLTESVKLFGRDKYRSKDLFRVTVCFRLKKEIELDD